MQDSSDRQANLDRLINVLTTNEEADIGKLFAANKGYWDSLVDLAAEYLIESFQNVDFSSAKKGYYYYDGLRFYTSVIKLRPIQAERDSTKFGQMLLDAIHVVENDLEAPFSRFTAALWLYLEAQSNCAYMSAANVPGLTLTVWLFPEHRKIAVLKLDKPIAVLNAEAEAIDDWVSSFNFDAPDPPDYLPAPTPFARVYWQDYLRRYFPRSTYCSDCGADNATHAHHEQQSLADLAREGTWHTFSAHKIVMLCAECHSKRHEGTSAANYLKVFTRRKVR